MESICLHPPMNADITREGNRRPPRAGRLCSRKESPMRKICLALLVVGLGAATPIHAQDSMMQKLFSRPVKRDKEPWATQYAPEQTTPPGATVVPASEP